MDWRTLYQDNYPNVFAFVFSVCGDRITSEDITQETFIKAYQNIDKFRRDCKVIVWLNRIAYHQLLDHKKKKTNLEVPSKPEIFKDISFKYSIHEQFEQKVMSQCVQSKVNLLPENYRAVVFLDMQGYSNIEIANILDCTLDNAKVRLHRGRKKLKEILGNDCGFFLDERNVLC